MVGDTDHGGNRIGLHVDCTDVRCDRFREAASARLDGEPIGMSVSVLDHHLATCVACSSWNEQATRLTRQLRLGPAEIPDLADSILAEVALPAGRVLRRRLVLRLLIAVVAVVQLVLAAPSLFGDSIDMAMAVHGAHETAAWNLALGAAFLATAIRPRRAGGLLPVLVVFVGVLGALSIRDVASGAVDIGRLATHIAVLIGLGLVFGLHRLEESLPPQRWSRVSREDGESGQNGGNLRGVA